VGTLKRQHRWACVRTDKGRVARVTLRNDGVRFLTWAPR
jgi:hypothetical protein